MSQVGVLALALAAGGACSDDGTDDATTTSETSASPETSDAGGSSESDATIPVVTTVDETADPVVATTTSGPSATDTTEPECDDDVVVVDAGENPGEVEPGDTFDRTWEVENSGDCMWTSEYAWTFTGGDALTIESVTPIERVPPGERVEVTVTLQAPAEPGRYAGQFQLVAPGTMEPLGPAMPYTVEVTR